MRILVTNDDGIDSIGLHALAAEVSRFGDVTVVAPDTEYSGCGASLGTLTFGGPVVRQHTIDAIPDLECWSVTGPPALCVMYAQLGAFGEPFDFVVSGINPGQNVGWSVYHSGTVGAALTGRNRGASGLAVSLGFNGKEVEGQTWKQIVDSMNWRMAAEVAGQVLDGLLAAPATEPMVVNLNIPNGELSDVIGWDQAAVGTEPPRRLTKGHLIEGDEDEQGQTWSLQMDWGSDGHLAPGTDGWLVANKRISVTWLGHLADTPPHDSQSEAVGQRLEALISDNP